MSQSMCLFTCPKCSSNIFSDEVSHCFLCDGEETTNNGVDGNFEHRQQENVTIRDTDVESGSRNILIQNCTQMSEVSMQNRERTQSNNRMTVEDNKAYKQCRREICVISDKVLSPLCKPGNKNIDFLPEIFHKESGNSNSNYSQPEFLNVEKPQSYNQVEEAHCSSGEMGLLTANKNSESNKSILQCFQKPKAPGKISDFKASSVENFQLMANILPVQSPSDLCVNEHGPNVIGQNLHSGGSFKVQSVKPVSQKKLPCNVCDVEIREHAKKKGRIFVYFCCVCKYKTQVEAYLQTHSDIHCPQKVCNVCSKEYRDGNLHDSEHTCKVCKIKFDCETLLDQHSVEHEEYFLEHCRLCVQELCEHFTNNNGRRMYLCCGCNFRTKAIYDLRVHSKIHRPKLFCMICKQEYPMKEKNFHSREWNCNVCGMEFDCKTLLEDHSVKHKDYFSSHCRICQETIDKHYFKFEDKYNCCFCAKKYYDDDKLQQHLDSHITLRLFKCDWCERLFSRNEHRLTHSKTCLRYKCEICGARFPCSVSHDKHRLEKHGKTGENTV